MMSLQHEKTVLSSESPYIDRNDPASRKKLQVGDHVTICRKKSEAFLTSSLSASANCCPFCQEQLSNDKIPVSSRPSQHPKKPVASKPSPVPAYEENRRTNWGGLAALGTGGIFLIVLLCAVGALIIFAINSGNSSGTYDPDPVSYPTQKPNPTSVPIRVSTPTKKSVPESNNNQSSAQQQSSTYAEISCSEIVKVNLRRTPGYVGKDNSTDSLYEVPCGEIIELLGPTKKVDGLTWWKVSWEGYTGWIADHTGSGKVILDFDP